MAEEKHSAKYWILTILSGVAVLLIVAFVVDEPTGFRNSVRTFLSTCLSKTYNFFVYRISVPLWALMFLTACFLYCAYLLYDYFRRPAWSKYVSDQFFEATWRWRWSRNNIVSLTPHCPKDATQLAHRYHPRTIDDDAHSHFACETCGLRTRPSLRGSRPDALAIVERQIRRKTETGEWREMIKAYKA